MKTFKNSTLENFANEAITANEMNYVRGGGALGFNVDPLDITVPPKK